MKNKPMLKENMPQFGSSRISIDAIFGRKQYYTGWCYTTPAIRCKKDQEVTVQIDLLTPVTPFSSGSQADNWEHNNCPGCKKREKCALMDRINLAYLGDGTIPFKTAKRIGYESISVQKNGIFVELEDCNEYEE